MLECPGTESLRRRETAGDCYNDLMPWKSHHNGDKEEDDGNEVQTVLMKTAQRCKRKQNRQGQSEHGNKRADIDGSNSGVDEDDDTDSGVSAIMCLEHQ